MTCHGDSHICCELDNNGIRYVSFSQFATIHNYCILRFVCHLYDCEEN